jgi:hypothetical protein
MGLYERLLGLEQPRLSVHLFSGLIGEWERGFMTGAEVSQQLGLSPAEEAEAITLIGRIVPPRESISLGAGPVAFANIGTSYDGAADQHHGLGIAVVQAAGITRVTFGVRTKKVGIGTQSWQLWNDTDGGEIAVIDDAGAAGIKNMVVQRDFAPALGEGVKVMRVRAKSTVAGDDPVYLGATVGLTRVSILTALELHEILLIGDSDGSIYHDVAAVKARLGV